MIKLIFFMDDIVSILYNLNVVDTEMNKVGPPPVNFVVKLKTLREASFKGKEIIYLGFCGDLPRNLGCLSIWSNQEKCISRAIE